jgi:TonB family protein
MVLSFPLVGEDHPLRQHAAGILFKSALLSMMLHGIFAGGRIFIAHRFPPAVEFEAYTHINPIFVEPVPDFEEKIPIPVKPVSMPVFPEAIPDPVPFDPDMDWTDEIQTASPGPSGPVSYETVVADSGGIPSLESGIAGDSDEVLYPSTPPEPVFIPEPEYPQFARDAGIEGDVVLSLKVGVSGRVEEIQVLSGVPMLDAAAIDALSLAVFRPAQHNGRIVTTWIVVPVRFTLD